MLGRIFSRTAPAGGGNRKPGIVQPAPDISRVIKPACPTYAATFTGEATESLAGQAERALDNLSEQFETWMRGDLEALRAAWAGAQQPGAAAEDYRRLYTAAHNITGAAPSYGFPAAARLGRSLCQLLSQTRPGENAPLINLHVEACRAAVAAGPEGQASQSLANAVCDALERQVAARLTG